MNFTARTTVYLVLEHRGRVKEPGVRVTKKLPALARNEISVKLEIEVPEALFLKPALEAAIRVPEPAKRGPVIDAEVIGNIEQIVSEQTGLDLAIRLVSQDDEEHG